MHLYCSINLQTANLCKCSHRGRMAFSNASLLSSSCSVCKRVNPLLFSTQRRRRISLSRSRFIRFGSRHFTTGKISTESLNERDINELLSNAARMCGDILNVKALDERTRHFMAYRLFSVMPCFVLLTILILAVNFSCWDGWWWCIYFARGSKIVRFYSGRKDI